MGFPVSLPLVTLTTNEVTSGCLSLTVSIVVVTVGFLVSLPLVIFTISDVTYTSDGYLCVDIGIRKVFYLGSNFLVTLVETL